MLEAGFYNMDCMDGMTLTEKIRQKQEAAHVRTGAYIRHRKCAADTKCQGTGDSAESEAIE